MTLTEMGIVCPKCHSDLRHVLPKPGGKQFRPFYGCSTFPRCRETMSERGVSDEIASYIGVPPYGYDEDDFGLGEW